MHKLHKTLSLAAGLLLVVGAGCTQATTTTNVPANTNSTTVVVDDTNTEQGNVNANTNTVVDNVNTNETVEAVNTNLNTSTESNEVVDTSDWLTYTNEEYGFSFRYPGDAKLIENANNLPYPGISFFSDITVDNTKQEDLQGVTVAFALTDLDLTTLTQKIEQSDTSRGLTLAKVGPIQEGTLNQLTVYQGSHATAIGIPTDFYYIPLKNNFALFIFYNSDKNNVNGNIINTLSVEN
jgi:hypothetical protein